MEVEDGAPSIFSTAARSLALVPARSKATKPTPVSSGGSKKKKKREKSSAGNAEPDDHDEGPETLRTFESLGLSTWLQVTCKELGMARPTPVQEGCIPQILNGKDVFGMAQTGSGKTAAFALPILQKLAENPYGIYALVLTPTRELAFQIADQFNALGSAMSLRCTVVVGGMEMTAQAQALMNRPHVVIATPGRMKDHLISDPDMPGYFSKAKFLVLDEADRLLEVGFEGEMRTILQSMPSSRQTLLFSATMTGNLKALHELSSDKAFFYEAYQGFKTVETLKQEYIFLPANVKDVYLLHLLSNLEDDSVRSVIIFASSCRTCHLLSLIMEEMDVDTVALHSMKTQQQRLASLSRFKAGQVPILIATDVASRGLDIPTVDLVINYDIPRMARDYVHRVGRTARAGRGGCAISLVTQYDVELVQEIEKVVGKKLEEHETKEDEVLKGITAVYKAKRVAALKMLDSGFEDKVKARRDLKDKGKRRREEDKSNNVEKREMKRKQK
ncbi:hypothetical protein AXG93_2490s1280 [Marchantia polymorpha subsp. ruderalis]|uniref:Uncharacterized protein n=1 Tax=Marchantia polymorpha subsp. ruderalis TaxID=1480154 RepID=A0A176W5M8_MARPO|nr:hypothetical protein AXG93_2490s1280 [Marchantia polymorpha subsp. ruderalis]